MGDKTKESMATYFLPTITTNCNSPHVPQKHFCYTPPARYFLERIHLCTSSSRRIYWWDY